MLRCHSQLLLSLCTVQCYNVPRYRLQTRGEDEPAAAVPRQAAAALQRQEAAPERGRPPLRRGQCRAQPARAAGHQGGSHMKKYYPLATTCKNITCIKNISDLQHHSELDTAPSQLGSLGRLVSRHTSLVTVPEPRPAPSLGLVSLAMVPGHDTPHKHYVQVGHVSLLYLLVELST